MALFDFPRWQLTTPAADAGVSPRMNVYPPGNADHGRAARRGDVWRDRIDAFIDGD